VELCLVGIIKFAGFFECIYNYVVIWLCGVSLSKYATISVPVDVKKRLEKAKGTKEWGEFLLELYSEGQRLKSKKAFEELVQTITPDDLNALTESSKEFRANFKIK
jgi:hypothetical protein